MLENNDQLRTRFDLEFNGANVALWRSQHEERLNTPPERGTAGMVTFFGPCIRGAFIVAQPLVPDTDAQQRCADWVGEMANQLAGRVKSGLYDTGIDFIVAPPLYLHGAQLSSAISSADCYSTHDSPNGTVYTWALLNVVGPIPEPCREAALVQEGEFLLF